MSTLDHDGEDVVHKSARVTGISARPADDTRLFAKSRFHYAGQASDAGLVSAGSCQCPVLSM